MFSPADVTMQEQSFSYANVTEQSILGIRVDFVDFLNIQKINFGDILFSRTNSYGTYRADL